MNKVGVIGITMLALLAGNCARGDICEIVNGSFEDDSSINDITVQEPNGWGVDVPANKFRGYVSYRHWQTDGTYSLTLRSEWFTTFDVNDMVTVYQELYLTDVNQITFGVKLETYSFSQWGSNICTALLLIDDEVVWESDSAESDARGEYSDQTYTVDDKYRDGNLHKLSLGLRVNVAEMLFERYMTHWDFVGCNLFCGGGGLLSGDFDRDCQVDINDLLSVSDVWLHEVASYDKYNLFRGDDVDPNGVVNFFDLALLADNWMGNSYK